MYVEASRVKYVPDMFILVWIRYGLEDPITGKFGFSDVVYLCIYGVFSVLYEQRAGLRDAQHLSFSFFICVISAKSSSSSTLYVFKDILYFFDGAY